MELKRDPAGITNGPDKALILEDESLVGSNSLMTSNVLSELAKKVDADIIIFGTESTDGYSGVVPQQVSRILNVPCISYVKNIEIDESVTLTRQTIEGSEKINLPENVLFLLQQVELNQDIQILKILWQQKINLLKLLQKVILNLILNKI